MSGKTWTAYVIGAVVGIVVGVLTAGVGLAAYAAFAGTLAFGVTSSLLMSQNATKGGGLKNAAAKDLEIASSSEAIAVPVVWGTARIGGNYMRYDRSTFRTESVYADAPSGGKGGGGAAPQLAGYKYYLSYLYGICMGELDAIYNVWDANEMKIVGAGAAFASDMQTITLSGSDFGGDINVYRGNGTQTPNIADAYQDLNYRHVCFAAFNDALIGSSPTPRTILFEVQRWPKVLDDTDTPIPDFYTTGSLTSAGRCWRDANPAAILYELFTNRIWGRGMSADLIDVPSFVEASLFFATNDIGISLAVDSQQAVGDIVDFVRRHVNAACVWDGEKLTLRVLMNPDDSLAPVVITQEQVNRLTLERPAWPETANELRLEFLNRGNAWKSEIVLIQDDAGIETNGSINSQRVTLDGFTDRTTAEGQAQRILNEMSYPQATLTFYMNRWASKLIPGDRVRFIWSEFTALAINTFWRVIDYSDTEQSDEGIKVTLAEDLYTSAYLGPSQPFATATPGFTGDSFNTTGDLYQGDDHNAAYDPGDMLPIRAVELTFAAARGNRLFAVLCEQGAPANLYGSHAWALHGSGDFTSFGATKGWAITGVLLSAIPVGLQSIDRTAAGAFTFSLTDDGNETRLLASANKAVLDADDLSTITDNLTDMLIVGNEVFFVGSITEISAGVYQAKNYLRAQLGTEREAHAIGDSTAFIATWRESAYVLSQGSIPSGVAIDLQTNTATPTGGAIATEFPWTGPASDTFLGQGAKPYTPTYLAHTKIGDLWNLTLRPRWHNAGAGSLSLTEDDLGAIVTTQPAGFSILVQAFNGGSPLTPTPIPVAPAFVPDDGTSAAGGVQTLSYTAPVGSTILKVWNTYNGAPSLAPLTIAA